MVKKSPRLAKDYAWVSFRGPQLCIEDASARILADVGAEAHGNCCKAWQVAGCEGVWELDYRSYYCRPSKDTLMGIIFDYPELKFRALTPKLYKYSEEHKEAYSKANTVDCVDLTYRNEYILHDYPNYAWWHEEVDAGPSKREVAVAPMTDAGSKALRDFKVKMGNDGVVITAYRGDETDVKIPATIGGKPVIAIGKKAFSEGFNSDFRLKSVAIPASVKEIEDKAFFECLLFGQVRFDPNSELASIGDEAFSFTEIKSIVIPRAVEHIGRCVFHGCIELDSIEVEQGNGCCKAENGVFYTQGGEELDFAFAIEGSAFEIPAAVTRIADYAFNHSIAERVFIPASVREIGEHAFSMGGRLNRMHEVAFEAGSCLERVRNGAFARCAQLRRIELPSGVTEVGESAFEGCDSFDFISLPETVKTFEKWFGDSCGTPFFAPGIPLSGIGPRDYKENAVIGFSMGMGEGASAPPDIEKGYAKYIKAHAENVLYAVGFDMAVLKWMISRSCIAAKDIAALSEAAQKMGLTDQAAILADHGNEPAESV